MNGTCEFLDALKARYCLPSDYALAKKLGLTHQTVSKYRLGKDFLGDSTALRVAELLEIDPAIVIASVHAERSKIAAEKAVWESIIERLGGAAAAVLLGIGLAGSPGPAAAADLTVNPGGNTHYANRRRAKVQKRGFVDVFTDWALRNRTFAA